jgi:hypothetical protein
MPYRRLPNTDQARIRALKAVVAKGDTYNVYDLAVSLKVLTDARNFLVKFEAAHSYYVECFERQSKAGRKHQANVKTARLYISHFIQVLNLAVIRSEVRTVHKEFYGLDMRNNNVPDLSTEAALAEWGRKIVEGESRRISQGGISNGLVVRHTCTNKSCCNPAHLILGTQSDNYYDIPEDLRKELHRKSAETTRNSGVLKGRSTKKNIPSKLSG